MSHGLRFAVGLTFASSVWACSVDQPKAVPAEEATPAPEAEQPAPTPAAAALPRSFGEPISEGETTSLASILESPDTYAQKTIRTEGQVRAVCQSAGCWMEIGDDSGKVFVKMSGHSFLVPRDCKGKRAIVEGTVVPGEPENTCASKDGCRGPSDPSGPVAKLELVATGVQLID